MSTTVKLISQDQVTFEVEERVARMFGTVDTMLESLGSSSSSALEENDEPIPLTTVGSATLGRLLKWCRQHVDDLPPRKKNEDKDKDKDDKDEDEDEDEANQDIPPWDRHFLDDLPDDSALFELITAANFLEVKRLMRFACKRLADEMKVLTPEQVRQRWGIKDDLTAEEKAQIVKSNEWCCSGSSSNGDNNKD